MAHLPLPRTKPLPALRHVREPNAIYFPEEAEVPEGKRHLVLRTFLFRLLQFALGPGHSVGSDQFAEEAAERGRAAAERERGEEAGARAAAEARVRELEAELARKR
jgi:hypothetical protein